MFQLAYPVDPIVQRRVFGQLGLRRRLCFSVLAIDLTALSMSEYMLQSRESSWGFQFTLQTFLNLLLVNVKRSSAKQSKNKVFWFRQYKESIKTTLENNYSWIKFDTLICLWRKTWRFYEKVAELSQIRLNCVSTKINLYICILIFHEFAQAHKRF